VVQRGVCVLHYATGFLLWPIVLINLPDLDYQPHVYDYGVAKRKKIVRSDNIGSNRNWPMEVQSSIGVPTRAPASHLKPLMHML
jgi:hypothetical protein